MSEATCQLVEVVAQDMVDVKACLKELREIASEQAKNQAVMNSILSKLPDQYDAVEKRTTALEVLTARLLARQDDVIATAIERAKNVDARFDAVQNTARWGVGIAVTLGLAALGAFLTHLQHVPIGK